MLNKSVFVSILARLIVVAMIVSMCSVAVAQETTWKGAEGGNWSADGNWTNGEPGSSTYAYIDNGNTAVIDRPGERCSYLYLGTLAGSNGKLSVQSGGSLSSRHVKVGLRGSGTLVVAGGGQLNATSTDLDSLVVGLGGGGTLSITNGGRVSSGNGILGSSVSTSWGTLGLPGIAIVDGPNSKWTGMSRLTVGDFGSGTLTVTNGGRVSDSFGYIGNQGRGEVTVDGDGSRWDNYSRLNVGSSMFYGRGTLTITNGGHVSSAVGFVGDNWSAAGTVTLDGANSQWVNTDSLYVGRCSSGTITITGGAELSSSASYLGRMTGVTGAVTVDGADSRWTNSSSLYLGYDETVFGKIGSLGGIGTLTVSGGGQVSQSVAYLGYANQSSGTVGISGAGSTWTAESLYLGGSDSAARGIGILNVANEGHAGVGAAMTLWATGLATVNGGTLAAGVLAGTAGTIRITDPAGDVAMTVGSTGSGDFSGSIVDDTGPGSLAKIGDGTQTLSGSNTYSGVTTIQEGTLLVNNPGSVVSPVIVKSGGTFGGTGTAASIAVSPGGHLAPGSSGVGVLTLTGNLTLDSGALLDFDLDAPAESDRILMPLSTLTLNGQQFSDFAFTAMADFGPGTYLLIDAGAIQGSGLGPNPTGTINGLRATLALGGASGNELVLNVVPEPGTLSLLGVVGIGLLASIRRRKSRGRVSNDPGDTRAAGPRTYVRGSPDDGCPLTADRLPALLDKPAVAPSAPDRLSLSAER